MLPLIRKPLLVLLLTAFLLTTNWLGPRAWQSAPPARAQEIAYWAKWRVELDFVNNQINANWIVTIGEYGLNDEMIITAKSATPIPCTPHGNITINDEEANFDGASYLECAIPSYYAAVVALLDGQPLPFYPEFDDYCECTNPIPWVTADLTLANPVGMNPLVHHIDKAMSFKIERMGDMATSHLLLNGSTPVPQQLSWTVSDRGNQVWSGSGTPAFLATTDQGSYHFLPDAFYQAIEGLGIADYLHWADTVPQGLVFTHSTKFTMTSQPTTFLVGSDTKHFFVGKLRNLSWDPSCDPPSGL